MNKKREIFVRLSNNRLNAAIKAIKLVGNLGNKSHYEYTDKDKKIIEEALKEAIKDAMNRFRVEKKNNENLIK
tara:strand:- start:370 stop:588 length:219 start_codon:yes stop_codon:yes gene_type:complete